jgi:hypothetical protein
LLTTHALYVRASLYHGTATAAVTYESEFVVTLSNYAMQEQAYRMNGSDPPSFQDLSTKGRYWSISALKEDTGQSQH